MPAFGHHPTQRDIIASVLLPTDNQAGRAEMVPREVV
jgi:hypothetical protein